ATLVAHVEALETKAVYRLQELEKKMLRAEKRKFASQQHQLQIIRQELFPGGGLQERTESFMQYYAQWGQSFIEALYQHSLSLEQEFVIVEFK
ncbi:MAG: bacillithiol biosynthesis BshC, partial [Chitinophagaceae bacterium]|nr:bacillithiol biosynthesis BshC [Chitinophagaceae bacterium]